MVETQESPYLSLFDHNGLLTHDISSPSSPMLPEHDTAQHHDPSFGAISMHNPYLGQEAFDPTP